MKRVLVFLSLLWTASFAATQGKTDNAPQIVTFEQATRQLLLLRAIPPFSAYEARRNRWEGLGIFDLRFDFETGELREIHIVRSTGHRCSTATRSAH